IPESPHRFFFLLLSPSLYHHHPNPHSFPTRRSSDLKDTTNPWDVPTNADIADQTHLQSGHVNYTHPANNIADPFLSAYSAKAVPDRKSTRLNSSHEWISYAVFCLKKKKK